MCWKDDIVIPAGEDHVSEDTTIVLYCIRTKQQISLGAKINNNVLFPQNIYY